MTQSDFESAFDALVAALGVSASEADDAVAIETAERLGLIRKEAPQSGMWKDPTRSYWVLEIDNHKLELHTRFYDQTKTVYAIQPDRHIVRAVLHRDGQKVGEAQREYEG